MDCEGQHEKLKKKNETYHDELEEIGMRRLGASGDDMEKTNTTMKVEEKDLLKKCEKLEKSETASRATRSIFK